MMMTPTAIRLPADLLLKLKQLAHVESLRTGDDVTWSALVRLAIEKLLAEAAKNGVLPAHANPSAKAGAEFVLDPGEGTTTVQF
jgi:hypothetical protein